jgi:hypothetical protein
MPFIPFGPSACRKLCGGFPNYNSGRPGNKKEKRKAKGIEDQATQDFEIFESILFAFAVGCLMTWARKNYMNDANRPANLRPIH